MPAGLQSVASCPCFHSSLDSASFTIILTQGFNCFHPMSCICTLYCRVNGCGPLQRMSVQRSLPAMIQFIFICTSSCQYSGRSTCMRRTAVCGPFRAGLCRRGSSAGTRIPLLTATSANPKRKQLQGCCNRSVLLCMERAKGGTLG